MGNICFVGIVSIDEILIYVFHLKEHGFGFIRDICNEKQKGFSDIRDDGSKCFSGGSTGVLVASGVGVLVLLGASTRMVIGS